MDISVHPTTKGRWAGTLVTKVAGVRIVYGCVFKSRLKVEAYLQRKLAQVHSENAPQKG